MDSYIADLRAATQLGLDIKIFRMHRLGISQERIAKRLGQVRETIRDHLAKMPELANPPNADLSKGFTVAQVAEKHGWAEPLVWSIALDGKALGEGVRERIQGLASDFPRLWNDPATPQRERKRMAHLLLEDATLVKDQEGMSVHVRFKGGASRSLHISRALKSYEEWTTDSKVVAQIDRLLNDHTNSEAASILNQKGFTSGAGKSFHGNRISRIRRAYGLKSRYERLREKGMLTRKELALKQDVHQWTITKWRISGRVKGHLADDQGQYLFEDPGNVSLRLKKKKVKKSVMESRLSTKVA